MDFNLRDHTILLTLNGSRAYGLSTPSSDIDMLGIAVPPKEYYLGFLKIFEQADHSSHISQYDDLLTPEELEIAVNIKSEGSVYEVSKFIKLAADCNPNILTLLFCRDSDIRYITPLGQKIRDNRGLFLSKKAKFTFSGYAYDQMRRIILHRGYLLSPPTKEPIREDFDLQGQSIIPKAQLDLINASIRKVIDGWELDLSYVEESQKIYIHEQIERYLTDMNLYGTDAAYLSAAKKIGCDDKLIEVLEKERRYTRAHDEYRKYQEWKKNRNPARAKLEEKYGMDTKHASHLYRLMLMCREILTTGQVNIYREDREQILAIKNGAWTYDQIVEFAKTQDEELNGLYDKCTILPRAPDRVKIDNLCVEIIEESLKGNK
jgi:hypothetical protein